MAQNPLIKRYLDAGMAFTQMTQARAEAIVKDLVKAGEVQAQRTEELVNALVERSRQNTDRLLELVRKEVRDQIAGLGLATKDDIDRIESKLSSTPKKKKSAAKRSGAKKRSATRKSGTKKSSGSSKKTAAKKASKRSAKKSSGSRSSS